MQNANPYDQLAQAYDLFQNGRDQGLLSELLDLLAGLRLKGGPSLADQIRQVVDVNESNKNDNDRVIDAHEASELPLVLDLGCGSGRVSLSLLQQGWLVWGLDLSREQLKLADEKAFAWEDEQWLPFEETMMAERGEEAYVLQRQVWRRYLFEQADLLSFDLRVAKADLAVCWLDTINHLRRQNLSLFCQNVARGLKPGGLFIFDYLTRAYMEKYYASQRYEQSWGRKRLFWNNSYDAEIGKNVAQITLQVGAKKQRFTIEEEALEPEQAVSLLEDAGFAIVSHQPSSVQKERYIICARKL